MSRAPSLCGDNCFRVMRDLGDCISFPEVRNDSYLSSGKEIQSLKSLVTRKQLSQQREGARDTFGLKKLNPFIIKLPLHVQHRVRQQKLVHH